jgi:LAO/AO transport system kinase
MDDGVFIRSMATRGHSGGLTRSTRGAIDILDAMGKHYIIVETVGVGQDEAEIVKNAHTTVVIIIPGMGDYVQAMKSGILETGDIFLINKSESEGAEMTVGDLSIMIETGRKKYKFNEWKPPILKIEAILDKGVKEFMAEVERHRHYLMNASVRLGLRKNRESISEEIKDMIRNRILEDLMNNISASKNFNDAVSAVESGYMDPYSACDNLADSFLKDTIKQRRSRCLK